MTAPAKRKLIEVALPLEAISRACADEKNIRGGHPSNIHPWWARRPLAACRAVLFSSLVDDPSSDPERFPTPKAIEAERTRLFGIIQRLVLWENTTNETVLEAARAEILRSTNGSPPTVLDPFCGGGSIPLEAQRLGLTAHASDLNPVAVLITKALIEIPPRFVNLPPVHPEARKGVGASGTWKGAAGLAEDVSRYADWVRSAAEARIGRFYPKLRLSGQQGSQLPVVAWLWVRTVTCPNPACRATTPLARTFELSKKPGARAWATPVVDVRTRSVSFRIGGPAGSPPSGTVGRLGGTCLVCQSSIPFEHVRSEGRAGRLGSQLMATGGQGARGRVYAAPDYEQVAAAQAATPEWTPETDLPDKALGFRVQAYGMTKHRDLFTRRQLLALATFSDLISEVRSLVSRDAFVAGLPDDDVPLSSGGQGAQAYADAIATYLALALDKMAEMNVTLSKWKLDRECPVNAFGRQNMAMTWDYPEANPLGESAGSWLSAMRLYVRSFDRASMPNGPLALVTQSDARHPLSASGIVVTDPPYYDNIGYADLSDFHYVWLRHSLGGVWPGHLSTMLTPKASELIATPFRHQGSRAQANRFFEDGLAQAFSRVREASDPAYPIAIFYAFKQSEQDSSPSSAKLVATGWETMLDGLLTSGLTVEGTWPIRTELTTALKSGMNALASSIVLVCRPRHTDAGLTDRKGLLTALKSELPTALRDLQHGNIAPVDLAQASIGPGMAVFSRYTKVIEPDGSAMSVRTALGLINQVLTEVLAEQEDEFDADTRWAVTWFEQFGHKDAPFGQAEVLTKAKDTAINSLVTAGIVVASAGKVRLKRRDELDADWDPATDRRLTVWEVTQHLIRALDSDGELAAADLVRRMGGLADTARDLAYRLYSICERKKWAEEALGYNALVTAWPEITRLAASEATSGPAQGRLFG